MRRLALLLGFCVPPLLWVGGPALGASLSGEVICADCADCDDPIAVAAHGAGGIDAGHLLDRAWLVSPGAWQLAVPAGIDEISVYAFEDADLGGARDPGPEPPPPGAYAPGLRRPRRGGRGRALGRLGPAVEAALPQSPR